MEAQSTVADRVPPLELEVMEDDMVGIVEAVHEEEPPPLPPPLLPPDEPPDTEPSLPMALRVASRWLWAVDMETMDFPVFVIMVCSCVSFRLLASREVCIL